MNSRCTVESFLCSRNGMHAIFVIAANVDKVDGTWSGVSSRAVGMPPVACAHAMPSLFYLRAPRVSFIFDEQIFNSFTIGISELANEIPLGINTAGAHSFLLAQPIDVQLVHITSHIIPARARPRRRRKVCFVTFNLSLLKTK